MLLQTESTTAPEVFPSDTRSTTPMRLQTGSLSGPGITPPVTRSTTHMHSQTGSTAVPEITPTAIRSTTHMHLQTGSTAVPIITSVYSDLATSTHSDASSIPHTGQQTVVITATQSVTETITHTVVQTDTFLGDKFTVRDSVTQLTTHAIGRIISQINPTCVCMASTHSTDRVATVKSVSTNVLPELSVLSSTPILPTKEVATVAFSATTFNLSTAEAKKRASELANNLTIDAKSTASYKRKKSSAKDGRVSSKIIGIIGGIFIVVPFSLVILSDLKKILQHIASYGAIFKTKTAKAKKQTQ